MGGVEIESFLCKGKHANWRGDGNEALVRAPLVAELAENKLVVLEVPVR